MKRKFGHKSAVALVLLAVFVAVGVSGGLMVQKQAPPATVRSLLTERLSPLGTLSAEVITPDVLDVAAEGAFQEEQTDSVKRSADQPPTVSEQQELYCTLSISCATVLANWDDLVEEKRPLIPEDGVLLSVEEVAFTAGESVFDVLLREMQAHKIHLEFTNTPMYRSSYIEGIGNLYEFDCGDLSGWMYRVNGWFPNYGCDHYILADGDVIEWLYTCDLGRDIGDDLMEEGN